MEHKHFINLSNGILAIEEYGLTDYTFIRLQSTQAEQHRLDEIIRTISDDLLMNLALGFKCHIYDYGSRTEIPRAIYLGMEWVKFVLYKIWFDETYLPMNKTLTKTSLSMQQYFQQEYCKLSKTAKVKIKYYRKWVNTNTLNIVYHAHKTDKDGKYDVMKEVLTKPSV